MRDWVENVLITEPTMHKMPRFFNQNVWYDGGGTGGGGLPNRKTRKTSGIANWKEMVTKHAILSGCEQNRYIKEGRFDNIIVIETFHEILFSLPFQIRSSGNLTWISLLVIWAELGNPPLPLQDRVTNQAKIMRRLVAGGRFLCNFRIYRLIWEAGSVLRRCHQDIDAAAADIYNDV